MWECIDFHWGYVNHLQHAVCQKAGRKSSAARFTVSASGIQRVLSFPVELW